MSERELRNLKVGGFFSVLGQGYRKVAELRRAERAIEDKIRSIESRGNNAVPPVLFHYLDETRKHLMTAIAVTKEALAQWKAVSA